MDMKAVLLSVRAAGLVQQWDKRLLVSKAFPEGLLR